MDHRFWEPVVDRLEAEAELLTWDCRGHGTSDKPAGPYSAEQFADDLSAVLDAAGWAEVIAAGASMGGCVTLAFAGRHAARCRAIGLFDTTAWYGADAPKTWEERAQKAVAEGLRGLTDFQVTRWFSDDFRAANPKVAAECVEIFASNDPAAYAESCRMLGAADLRAMLPQIAAATSVLVGEEDYATPTPMAEALHAGIAGSTFAVIEGARHLTPLERPDRIADELRALIARSNSKDRAR